jgi:probable phosphoglycerate mutase
MIPAPQTPLALYLIRHGETAWSLSGQHTGRTDLPLTAHGEDEARDLLPMLGKVQFASVLTSPRQRARRTCTLAGLGHQAHIEPDLAEWDYGDYEGKLSKDIRKAQPHWNVFADGCPGGEMPDDITARADRLIEKLSGLEGNIALFSHGEFGLALAARWIGLPIAEGRHFLLGTASVSVMGFNPAHPEMRVITLWNATPRVLDFTRVPRRSRPQAAIGSAMCGPVAYRPAAFRIARLGAV